MDFMVLVLLSPEFEETLSFLEWTFGGNLRELYTLWARIV